MKTQFTLTLSIIFMVCVCACTMKQNTASSYKTESYTSRMAQFEKEKIEKGKIIFLGNSLTEGGNWSEYFPQQQPVNRGISGDNTQGMYARIDIIIGAQPKKLFILTGINDISQNVATKDIVANLKKIIQKVKKESPQTTIYIQSILPINNDFGRYKRLIGKEQQVIEYNQKLEQLSKKEKITFINLFPLYADENNKLIESYTNDGLHLKPEAYSIWADAIIKHIN